MIKKIILLSAFVSSGFVFISFQEKPKFNLKESIERGKDIYIANCLTCHLDQGEGIEDTYPPLAKSDYLMADKKRSIQQVLYGATGDMKVNGKTYSGEMSAFDLTDQQTSDVVNYIRNSFGNKGAAVTPEEVKGSRKK
ncbi:MAG TPA: cytochrome c [Cyclobacteriaceae bacterium]|nr:cytochrome c [Cyclobacteriaceae bacterium]